MSNEPKQTTRDCPTCGAKYLYPRWLRCEICAQTQGEQTPTAEKLVDDLIAHAQHRYGHNAAEKGLPAARTALLTALQPKAQPFHPTRRPDDDAPPYPVDRAELAHPAAPCPHISSSDEGTSSCDLAGVTAEELRKLRAELARMREVVSPALEITRAWYAGKRIGDEYLSAIYSAAATFDPSVKAPTEDKEPTK